MKNTTYTYAKSELSKYVNNVMVGDKLPYFTLRDNRGISISSRDDHLAGKHSLYIFINSASLEQDSNLLSNLISPEIEFDDFNIFIVTSNSKTNENLELERMLRLNQPILLDSSGVFCASSGFLKEGNINSRVILTTPMNQITKIFDWPYNASDVRSQFMQQITADLNRDQTMWFPCHAPVLMIPNVLSQEECNFLIDCFDKEDKLFVNSAEANKLQSNYKIPIYEHNRQDRIDLILKDRALLAKLDQKIAAKINPEISKAFAFNVNRREELHVARYEGKRDGNLMGHRDNTSPQTAYRKFALSLNLNDNYSGGEVFFKEYSKQGYKSAAGTAIIFSSSLLHEVSETTKGTRYTLISHLFNDSSINK